MITEIAISVVVAAIASFLLYIPLPMAARNLYRKRFWGKIGRSGRVCVTFDDGPNPKATPRILDILADAGVKATFFVTGENAQKHPEIVKRLVAEGHEVGEHGGFHSHPWKTGPFRSARDILGGARIIKRLTGAQNKSLFRPPYGKLNLVTLLYVLLAGKRMAFWNVDPRDYEQEKPENIVAYVSDRLAAGSVVLLHDARQSADAGAEVTVFALEGILQVIENKELKTATVGEALRRGEAKAKANASK